MPPKYYKTTESDAEVFRQSVIYWMSFFGLKGWESIFEHNDRHLDNRATCQADLTARHVTFTLTKSRWQYSVTQAELRLLGFHEVVELLLMRLQVYAAERNPSGDLSEIVHEVIHNLENSIFRLVEVEREKASVNKDNFDCESTKIDLFPR